MILATGDSNDLELLALFCAPHSHVRSAAPGRRQGLRHLQLRAATDGHAATPESVDGHQGAQGVPLQVFQLTRGGTCASEDWKVVTNSLLKDESWLKRVKMVWFGVVLRCFTMV